jgi:hypothetical protein
VSTHAKGTFENKSWDEDTIETIGAGKVSRASVKQSFTGDISGDSNVDWHMYYAPDGTASFVGLQRIDARVGDRTGTIVVQSTGVYDGKEARGDWVIVGATGDLAELSGTGEFSAPMGSTGEYRLDYDL